MKRLFILFAAVIMTVGVIAQEQIQFNAVNHETNTSLRYKLYPTFNMWTYLKLDTQTGRVTMLQFSTNSRTEEGEIYIGIPTATSPLHVSYTQQGNQAGNACEEMAVVTWIQISLECQKRTGQAGHRNAKIQNGDFRQRMFLARSRGCKQFVLPKTNTAFWQDKIERNRTRDTRIYNGLMNAGWQVIVIWACSLTNNKLDSTMQTVAVTLNKNLLNRLK